MSMESPPQIAERLAAALLSDAETRETVLGDLAEEFQLVSAQRGRASADRWYWAQVCHSLGHFLIFSLRAEGIAGCLRFGANVLVALFSIALLFVFSFSAAGWIWAWAAGGEYVDGVLAFGRSLWVVYLWWTLTLIFTGLGAGYVLARSGGSTGVAAAISVGIAFIPLGALSLATDRGTYAWLEASLSGLVLPAMVCGALLCFRIRGLPTCSDSQGDDVF